MYKCPPPPPPPPPSDDLLDGEKVDAKYIPPEHEYIGEKLKVPRYYDAYRYSDDVYFETLKTVFLSIKYTAENVYKK